MRHQIIATLTVALSTMAFFPSSALAQELPRLRQGMPYTEAREALLDAGWQAVYQSPNRQRTGTIALYMVGD